MDRLDAMATLLAAVDGGSLSAASRSLGMPLATVSRKVSDIEDHLRTQLVVRTSRRLLLTEAGHAYVASCRRILEQVSEAERVASGEYRTPRGNLTVTAPLVFGRLHVQPVLLDFLKTYPDITVRLSLADHLVNITDDQVDAAVRIGDLPDSRLVATRLGGIGWITCASPDYLAQRGTPQSIKDLLSHDCITFEGRYSSADWLFAREQRTVAVPIQARLAVNTAEAAIDAAIASAGITHVLSYQAADALRRGALTRVLPAFEPAPVPVNLLHTDQPLLPLKVRAFLDFAAPRLRASLARNAVSKDALA